MKPYNLSIKALMKRQRALEKHLKVICRSKGALNKLSKKVINNN